MRLTDVVLPTLAVAVSWLVIGAFVAGCGYVARRSLLGVLAVDTPDALSRVDLWVGLATLLAFLQVWSLVGGITWIAWIPPLCVGLVGLCVGLVGITEGRKTMHGLQRTRSSIAFTAGTVAAILWLANRALGEATDYDFGLYHLGVIRYASNYAAIPGLGNLHDRLGAGDAHFLFVALLDRGPWSTAGFQLANGLLVGMLLVDIVSRFVRRAGARRLPSFTRRMALLLVPATMMTVGVGTNYRLSSPNIDLAAFVLVGAGSLYLAECVERHFDPTSALASTGSLAAAAATRPLFWLPTAIAAALIVVGGVRQRAAQGPPRRVVPLLACTLPAALLFGWMARQAVLTGYPFFPITIGGLPVDWRMPSAVVHQMNQVVSAWARLPAKPPEQVLASWSWLGHWLHKRVTDIDVAAPLLLLAALPSALASRSPNDVHERRMRLSPMLAVLLAAVPTLVAWFYLAPDPRFALAPLWLVPISLIAWALPTVRANGLDFPPSTRVLVYTAGVCTVLVFGVSVPLATTSILAPVLLLPIALLAWTPERLRGSAAVPSLPKLLTYTTVASITISFAGDIAYRGGFSPIVANGGGPLGTLDVPTPTVVPFVTQSGLRLLRPTGRNDRCYQIVLCTPEPDVRLQLRRTGIGNGFAKRAVGHGP